MSLYSENVIIAQVLFKIIMKIIVYACFVDSNINDVIMCV